MIMDYLDIPPIADIGLLGDVDTNLELIRNVKKNGLPVLVLIN